MTEKEMLNCLMTVWENMTEDKDTEAYKEMLLLLAMTSKLNTHCRR